MLTELNVSKLLVTDPVRGPGRGRTLRMLWDVLGCAAFPERVKEMYVVGRTQKDARRLFDEFLELVRVSIWNDIDHVRKGLVIINGVKFVFLSYNNAGMRGHCQCSDPRVLVFMDHAVYGHKKTYPNRKPRTSKPKTYTEEQALLNKE